MELVYKKIRVKEGETVKVPDGGFLVGTGMFNDGKEIFVEAHILAPVPVSPLGN